MNKRRFRTLIQFLETKVKPARFRLTSYGSGCGTAGCVAGWCPEIPSFRKLGVHPLHHNQTPSIPALQWSSRVAGSSAFQYPRLLTGISVLAVVLGISNHEARWLFMPGSYPLNWCGLSSVIKRMKAFVAGTAEPPFLNF
jgi:hypothetical protein